MKRNSHGLLWSEWFAKATVSKKASEISPSTRKEMHLAWALGANPRGWAWMLKKGVKG